MLRGVQRTIRRAGLLTAVVTAGCAPGPAGSSPAADRAAWLDEVVETERAFAALAADSTVQHAFATFLAPEGILFRPGPLPGSDALASQPMPPDLALAWQPAFADVSAAGDLGFTTGPWRAGRRGTHPDSLRGAGQYVTLWRRTPGGFRFALDIGISHAPGLAHEPADVVLAVAPPSPGPGPAPDPERARDALLIADQDLGQALADGDPAAYRSYATPDVRVLRNGTGPGSGPDALIATAPPFAVESAPDGAEIAASADLGYTYGSVRARGNAEPAPIGYYLRIWRRQDDGSWKLTLDLVSIPPG
jgi:ketosteroid isomerase-like protein